MNDTPRHWQPLTEVPAIVLQSHPAEADRVAEHYGITAQQAFDWLHETRAEARHYINDLYLVRAAPCGRDNKILRITIERYDGDTSRDWRHFQQIKNEIAGPEREAVEIYPAESRKVDTSNKWHLWVMPDGVKIDLGFPQRDVQYNENRDVPGIRQRAL